MDEETMNDQWMKSLCLLMNDSRAGASNGNKQQIPYLMIEGNKRWWSRNYQNEFHWMIGEGYLHVLPLQSLLSRITVPIRMKLALISNPIVSLLILTKEGRSIHSSPHLIPLFIVNVFLKLKGLVLIVSRFSLPSPTSVNFPSLIDRNEGKSK